MFSNTVLKLHSHYSELLFTHVLIPMVFNTVLQLHSHYSELLTRSYLSFISFGFQMGYPFAMGAPPLSSFPLLSSFSGQSGPDSLGVDLSGPRLDRQLLWLPGPDVLAWVRCQRVPER